MALDTFRGTSSLLLLLAIATTAGFLVWLYQRTESMEQGVTPVTEDSVSGAPSEFSLERLRTAPGEVVGQSVSTDTVAVGGSLGRGVFTLRLNDTLSYPVLMSSDLIQRGTTVYGGDRVVLEGRFFTLTDSIRDAWVAGGAVDSGSSGEIPAMPSFLLAETVNIIGAGG